MRSWVSQGWISSCLLHDTSDTDITRSLLFLAVTLHFSFLTSSFPFWTPHVSFRLSIALFDSCTAWQCALILLAMILRSLVFLLSSAPSLHTSSAGSLQESLFFSFTLHNYNPPSSPGSLLLRVSSIFKPCWSIFQPLLPKSHQPEPWGSHHSTLLSQTSASHLGLKRPTTALFQVAMDAVVTCMAKERL